MKTNGLREIDFTKMPCKNCGANSGLNLYVPDGKLFIINKDSYLGITDFKIIDCPKCNGTSFTEETGPDLELE